MNRVSNQLFDAYFMQPEMREIFSDEGRVQGMLDFEAALARAQARVGLIPPEVVADIELSCDARLFDFDALAIAIGSAGNSAIPLVKALGKQIAARSAEAERYVHMGATSQDVMDSGLILQLRRAIVLLERDLTLLADAMAEQAQRHAGAPLAGRTWLQQATPVTLGMKIAGWLGAVTRHRQRLNEIKPRLLCLQFGGASGSLAALGDQAFSVAEALAGELQLELPEQPWHTQRDRLVEFAGLLGLIAGSLGKLGRDVSLLMQTEVGEVFEPLAPGKGGSSTMPHKRNPVGAAVMISTATRDPRTGAGRHDAGRHAAGARAQSGPVACRVGDFAGAVLSGFRFAAASVAGATRSAGRCRAYGEQSAIHQRAGARRGSEHCAGSAHRPRCCPPSGRTVLPSCGRAGRAFASGARRKLASQ
ncbi:3-carboxy-cis,cis-muconate cycloisomerase [Pseudomonas ficuserectae]|nr:3-carboxy-cis,cis-muconate cycloisomerase [Pseudomonas ficuserectae]RMS35654.1 3-carboxy-cis,cis-muconate cycloisomerase [Pseudomonas ficuserectae]